MHKKLFHKFTLGLWGLSLLLLPTGCNQGLVSDSQMTAANGIRDEDRKFPATVYVEMDSTAPAAKGEGSPNQTIRNVGTFVDMGLPGYATLLLPLGDTLQRIGANAQFPILGSMSLKIYLNDRVNDQPVVLPQMTFDDNVRLNNGVGLLVVGMTLNKYGDVPGIAKSKVEGIVERVRSTYIMGSTLLANGKDFNNQYTTYAIVGLPLSLDGRLAEYATGGSKAARLVSAEERPSEQELKGDKMFLVGYGDTSKAVHGTIEVTAESHRNAAPVQPLNVSSSTPLRKATGALLGQQLWEVKGSGLCISNDGKSYDMGASIYRATDSSGKKFEFLGFAARSTTMSKGFKGGTSCQDVQASDMATLVVSVPNVVKNEVLTRLNTQQ